MQYDVLKDIKLWFKTLNNGNYYIDLDMAGARIVANLAREALSKQLNIDYFETYKYIEQVNERVVFKINDLESNKKDNPTKNSYTFYNMQGAH
jgi:hypothetical protein